MGTHGNHTAPRRRTIRYECAAGSRAAFAAIAVLFAALACGCTLIGPDYVRPEAPVAAAWMETGEPAAVHSAEIEHAWWRSFGDPVLDALVERAYRQNPSLQTAGARVLEALARRGIAIGSLFPQQQEAFGNYLETELSDRRANQAGLNAVFDDWQVGFDAVWELDVWGALRRSVESADAAVLAAVAGYDDVLLTLIAEVARNYVVLRTTEERLDVAHANVAIQDKSFAIADARYRDGATSELDAAQAASLLEDTRSLIPELEATRRQTENTLCILLGLPPQDLGELLAGRRPIPGAPESVAIGIPADLMRRRPDVRRAERNLAAQSAEIGVAKADFLPHFALVGSISLAAEDFADVFKANSFEGFGGPSFRWAILNYGRIANNVRVQDARYQALVGVYEDTVLRAQAEVENSIAAFLGAERRVRSLALSVDHALRAYELADYQYVEGAADYTRVLDTQQFLVAEQDRLVSARGSIALSLVSLYKALGGGWALRAGEPFVSAETSAQMTSRTRWGGLVDESEQVEEIETPAEDTDGTVRTPGDWRWQRW